jgi:hypothetical protein
MLDLTLVPVVGYGIQTLAELQLQSFSFYLLRLLHSNNLGHLCWLDVLQGALPKDGPELRRTQGESFVQQGHGFF